MTALPSPSIFEAKLAAEDDSLYEVVLTALTVVIGVASGRRDQVYTLAHAYAYLATLPYATGTGIEPPIAPDLDVQLSNGSTVLKHNGWTPAFLDKLADDEADKGVYGQFGKEVVDAFVPEELQRVMAVVVTLGPIEAHNRLLRAVESYARRTATTGKRIGEPISAGTLSGFYSSGRRFLEVLVGLHTRGYTPPEGSVAEGALAQWTTLPPTIDVRGYSHAEDGGEVPRDAPSEVVVSRVLARLTDLLALCYRSNGELRDRTNFKFFRDFVLVVLVCVAGPRESSLFLRPDGVVKVHDYDPEHRFPGTDYVGPALHIRVARKGSKQTQTRRHYKTQWIALPALAAQAMETYLDIVGTREQPDAPLWVKQWADADARFLISITRWTFVLSTTSSQRRSPPTLCGEGLRSRQCDSPHSRACPGCSGRQMAFGRTAAARRLPGADRNRARLPEGSNDR